MAAHRLLSSDDVDPTALLTPHVARTAAACNGRRVVAVQDTAEINFDRHRRPAFGLGPTGNDEIRGFFIHPVVAVDADDEALLGVAGARIWTRGEEPTPNHNDIPFDEKESRRWLEAAELAATHLAPVATQVIMVADREGDIYPMFARRPEAIDFVVRACHNRVLAEGGTLFAAPAAWPALGRVQIKIAPKRPGDKGRKARIVLKARTVPSDFPVGNPAYAFLVTSAVALGRIDEIDLADARSVQGILAILTHENSAAEIRKVDFFGNGGQASESIVALGGPEVWHDGIELFTTTCTWNGPQLTIYEPSQFVPWAEERGGAAT